MSDFQGLSDLDLVHAIMDDPQRKENMRMALRRFMQVNHPVAWTMRRSRMLKAVDDVIDTPQLTPELIAACRAMYPFRHATGEN